MTANDRLPYPGLRAYTREESDLFFGREKPVRAMVDRFAASRFLVALGASGSGKSSLVRTGFLEALDLGLHPTAGSRWLIADMHPGGSPLRNLAAALLQTRSAAPFETQIDILAAFLAQGPRSLVNWVSSGNLPSGWNLLVLVDQFEELFRYGDYSRREEAEAFVALLLESTANAQIPIHVVTTMRSEYLGACSLIPGLAERMNDGLYLTPRMTREECREAIEGPAGVIGFRVEQALVNRLLNDLGSFAPWESNDAADHAERLSRQSDQLPVMQHVLNRLWIRSNGSANGEPVMLPLADYEGLGGLSGALDAHGAEIMASLGSGQAKLVERAFRALVTGPSVALAVRRPTRFRELVDICGAPEHEIKSIIGTFAGPGCNFLRTSNSDLTDDTIVDISHESLIRQWTLLRVWMEEEIRAVEQWGILIAAQRRHEQNHADFLAGESLRSVTAWWSAASVTPAWARRQRGDLSATSAFLNDSLAAEKEKVETQRKALRQQRTGRRIGAFLIDYFLFWLGMFMLVQTLHVTAETALFYLWSLAFCCRDILGRSAGKLLLGLIVSNQSGGPSTIIRRLARNWTFAFGFACFEVATLLQKWRPGIEKTLVWGLLIVGGLTLPYVVEMVMLFATGDRLGDRTARTTVIRKNELVPAEDQSTHAKDLDSVLSSYR